ncbi:hypothetical protein [Lyngbya confervoides]|uniref:Uncharacterized protein n=1 Tax=Lyngbya confervoides BDU141951 TaxID=1574623 RepID=A0ABD4TBT0_9CYAN|nr:hypothetical protein [Lyngbya confervoides]MCM1985300.1 hypothetical protein [Lyngbya confervoides BDU141951]
MNFIVASDMSQSLGLESCEQVIYSHLLACVKAESPEQVLQRFHRLFILGQQYPDPKIRQALEQLLRQHSNTRMLLPFFNRCCHILVNRWQLAAADKQAVSHLLELIKQVQTPSRASRGGHAGNRLRLLVYQFAESDYFQQLNRIGEFVRGPGRTSDQAPLVTLIHRYPYLYSHCLLSQQDDPEQQRIIRVAQVEKQKEFEQNLSRYMALSTVNRGGVAPLPMPGKVENPTLLSHRDLQQTLKHFVGPVNGRSSSYRHRAQRFIRTVQPQTAFADFKQDIYQYLLADLDPQYVHCRFGKQLQQTLATISPEQDRQPMTNILMNRTFTQLLNFLVIESRRSPQHAIFMDLISNLGSTQTVGLLLKLVLLEKSVRTSLERRISVLFNHYENYKQAAVGWLVRCLEKVNLAFTTHFSKLDFSYLGAL